MKCPFLREANVRYCRAAPFKKMIVHRPGQPSGERCSSPDYVNCPVAKQQETLQRGEIRCPFLDDCLVQYCAAASVTKYIPYSESGLSRCGTDAHRYCELYLAVAGTEETGSTSEPSAEQSGPRSYETGGDVHTPGSLWYSKNHFWLDVSPGGMIHVGIDAFMAAVLGKIQRLDFVAPRGMCHPAVVMSARDVELRLVFPNEFNVVRCNDYLRTALEKITAHPYGSGWLFEGTSCVPLEAGGEAPETRHLLSGGQARQWMRQEMLRLTEHVQMQSAGGPTDAVPVLADGGVPCFAHLSQLPRPSLLRLFHDFFRL